MISSKNAFNPRFIHLHDLGTIAYVRDNDIVYFSMAVKSPKDKYEKSVGRKVSSDRLVEAMKYLPIDAGYELSNYVLRDSLNSGFVRFSRFIEDSRLSIMLSDQMIDKMNFNDIKHVAISSFLTSLVTEPTE